MADASSQPKRNPPRRFGDDKEFPPKDCETAAKHRAAAEKYRDETQKEREEKSAQYEKERERMKYQRSEFQSGSRSDPDGIMDPRERRMPLSTDSEIPRHNDPDHFYPMCNTCGLYHDNQARLSNMQSCDTQRWEIICNVCVPLYLYPHPAVATIGRDGFYIRRSNGEFEAMRMYHY